METCTNQKLSEKDKVWDIVVVGGGATGLGVAVDAATRQTERRCTEKPIIAQARASTKLVHGGVRLQKGDVMLVLSAARTVTKANAPIW